MKLSVLKNYVSVFILLGLTTTAFLFALRDIADLDIWWHLAAGRWMVEHGSIISTDILSYTFQGTPWLSMTWGYEAFIYFLYNFFSQSFAPIVVFHAVIAGLSLSYGWLTYKEYQEFNNEKMGWAGCLFLATLWILELRWNHRAEMLTYLYFTITLFLLARCWRLRNEGRKYNKLYFIILIQLLWVNSHGLFPFGPFMIASYYFSDLIERRQFSSPFLNVFIASCAICFLNPYGLNGVLWPIHLFSILRDPFYHLAIEETRTAFADTVWLRDAWALMIWLCLLAGQFIFVFFSRNRSSLIKKFGAGYFVSALVLAWLAISARRNISLLIVATAPQLISSFVESMYLLYIKSNRFKFRIYIALPVFFILMLLVPVGIITNFFPSDQSATRFGWDLHASRFPDRAVQFLNTHPSTEKIFSDTQFANYALFRIPGFNSFIDSRYAEIYTVEHLKLYLAMLSDFKLFENQSLNFNFPIVALTFDVNSQPLINYLIHENKWQLAFYDEASVIFVRSTFVQKWLGDNFHGSLALQFETAWTRIQSEILSRRFLDKISFKYQENDRVWPLVQLTESSLLVGEISGAKKANAYAVTLAPENRAVKNTQCETAYFYISDQLIKNQFTQSKKNELCYEGIKACQKAISQGNPSFNLREYMAYFKLNAGEIEGAIVEFKTLVQLTNRRDYILLVAELELNQQRFQSAFDNFKKAQQIQFEPQLQKKLDELQRTQGFQ